ncbi:gamma-glutamyltransferase [Marinivivus vitaminiproducens]|uniref:gamma-glutamyltransferase n=1 Tax=Marinivivus vitaminiproducens TaxID=3035935 RepID=UPI0027A18A31|nr:gamma-glutamyltransferase [Geminicoccaceae bacterium SCSIO 64248]
MTASWRDRSPVPFVCEKRPASAAGGMVVTNHPLASAAGAEMLAVGGNAVDAAVASLLALTVVEPMMVGVAGGGQAHIRLADGRQLVIDVMSTAPGASAPDIYEPVADGGPRYMDVVGRRNLVGPTAVAVPGNLVGWCSMAERFGRLPLADLTAPAIRLAADGFRITDYLSGAIRECAPDFKDDAAMAAVFLPDGDVPSPGYRLVQGDYAESLRLIAREGAGALHGGALGRELAQIVQDGGGWVSADDLASYRAYDREPIVGTYRGYTVAGPPPPASSGVHVNQMLSILEGFDVDAMGFGTPESLHLLAEILKIGFADRRAASGDPAFVDVPVARLTSKDYAARCRARIDLSRARPTEELWPGRESADTTHVTTADRDGNLVTATHTINSLFGARFMVPGTGIVPNNYMSNFDPHPGKALSIVPGKRVPTSMAPLIVSRDGKPVFALGLPGGLRIFPSAFQAIVNLIDHGMSLQEAVEAPRLWTQGHEVEIERGYASQEAALTALGHGIRVVPHIGGGMNAIRFEDDGAMTGAACWRADGTVLATGGGLARPGIRFGPVGATSDTPAAKEDATR